MPKSGKPRRQRPANNVPEYIVKDADTPQDNSNILCEGAELSEYLSGLEQDERYDFDLTPKQPDPDLSV